MAVYKVPQDVEAEDKLLGPFSFKQFIFLIITTMSLGIAYALSNILLPLALIPMPFAILFGILAAPIRKDQPMEVYLAAIISFILKPKIRLWSPDGIESRIVITASKVEDEVVDKNYSQEEVHKRLSFLANIMDSGGWSVRNTNFQSSMQDDLFNEAQATSDLLDTSGTRSQAIDNLLAQTNEKRRQTIINNMQQPVPQTPSPQATPEPVYDQSVVDTPNVVNPTTHHQGLLVSPSYTPMSVVQPAEPDDDIQLVVNPYPTMRQGVITPLSEQANDPPIANSQPVEPIQQPVVVAEPAVSQPTPTPTPSLDTVSPAIIDLATNHSDMTIDTLKREADRRTKNLETEEVIISLR